MDCDIEAATSPMHFKVISSKKWNDILRLGRMRCKRCGLEKPLNAFSPSKYNGQLRYKRSCRKCLSTERNNYKREWWHKRRCYELGITPEIYSEMITRQRGNCAICERPLSEDRKVIDHDHQSGEVRGIVHNLCNLTLGNSREDIAVLVGTIQYLLKQAQNGRHQNPWLGLLRFVSYVEVKS
ncbi:MAG: endonuclease VII domain-containing protein [Planctomycetes bacterium]|nr:endonuclease VII domain-containing protein [Planctomycetota bacterium]MBE7466814.1 endonuclease VII domain-containing protein [Planctomycetota bacterium]